MNTRCGGGAIHVLVGGWLMYTPSLMTPLSCENLTPNLSQNRWTGYGSKLKTKGIKDQVNPKGFGGVISKILNAALLLM